jgi:hypothetical protein
VVPGGESVRFALACGAVLVAVHRALGPPRQIVGYIGVGGQITEAQFRAFRREWNRLSDLRPRPWLSGTMEVRRMPA